MEASELIEFAKWYVHERRKNLKMQDNVNAVEFASNLMSELCANHPFEDEHRVIAEYKKSQQNSRSGGLGMNEFKDLIAKIGFSNFQQIIICERNGFSPEKISSTLRIDLEDVIQSLRERK